MHREDVILRYLKNHMPGNPLDITIDLDLVEKLVDDLPHTNLVDEIKAFRWYHNIRPADRVPDLPLAIHRWIAHSSSPRP
jgi:hypothetical protein